MFASRPSLRLARIVGIAAVAALAGTVGCERPRAVAVRVSIPGPDTVETPVAGVGVVALPYDRDSVLRELERRARTPRPPTAPLESLFTEFRGPFAAYSAATLRLGKLRDSLAAAQAALASLRRGAPEYSRTATEVARLRDSVARVESTTTRARAALDRARRDFAERGDTLRLRMRQWEDSTYRGYDSLVQELARRVHREPATDTTGADGWAHLNLAPGRWWIYARSWDATDPNAEWYWNVPVSDDTVLLSSRTARRQPRF